MSMSTHLANRVRQMLADRNDWARFPDDVREWLEVQSERSVLPEPHQLLVETFPHEGRITWSPTASKAGTRTSRSAC